MISRISRRMSAHAASCPPRSASASDGSGVTAIATSSDVISRSTSRATRSANTSPSSSELDASRLAPCTPVRCHLARRPEPGPRSCARRGRCGCRPWRSAAPAPPAAGPSRDRGRGAPASRGCRESAWRSPSRCARIEEGAAPRVRLLHRARHHVARAQLAAGVGVEREAAAVPLHQVRARAAHGLGDERSRVDAGQPERGGMELQELEVAQLRAHLVRKRPAVAGGAKRVGGDGVDLSHSAGREHDGARRNAERPALRVERHGAHHPIVLAHQTPHFRVLENGDLGQVSRHRREAAHQLGAGAVAVGVQDARARMRAPRGRSGAGRRRCGRSRRRAASSSRMRSGPSVTRTRTASGSDSPSPASSVSCACSAGESPGPMATAIPPCAHAVALSASLPLVSSSGAAALAGESPRGPQARDAGADDDRGGF